jgi:hypothetical protein
MINRRELFTSALAGLALFVSGATLAETPKKTPSGTVSIDETQIAFIVGGSFGKGELKFQGKKHDFKINGISAGANFGASKISAVGEVYDLKKLADFPAPMCSWKAPSPSPAASVAPSSKTRMASSCASSPPPKGCSST